MICNADGKIDAVLRRYGIMRLLSACITDSGNVGHEKPHPAIFAAALREMNADPADSLYVGDVYSVDYVGARKAGMQAVLFDVAGAYREREFRAGVAHRFGKLAEDLAEKQDNMFDQHVSLFSDGSGAAGHRTRTGNAVCSGAQLAGGKREGVLSALGTFLAGWCMCLQRRWAYRSFWRSRRWRLPQ